MAAPRRCRRFMGLALTSGPLLVAGVVWASPAQADAASYLNDMHNVGIQDFDGGDVTRRCCRWARNCATKHGTAILPTS